MEEAGSVCLGHFANKDKVSVICLFPCTIGKDWQTWDTLAIIVAIFYRIRNMLKCLQGATKHWIENC